MIKCVIGLGNPGIQYENTRHNIGFMALDKFVDSFHGKWRKRWWRNYKSCELKNPVNVFCCKPETYMNLSGNAFGSVKKKEKITDQNFLIVYDDVHLPLGKIRFRESGSAGGHNGLQSIINMAGSEKIPRLRIGIGNGKGGRVEHVLGPFADEEKAAVTEMINTAAKFIELLLLSERSSAVSKINSFELGKNLT